MFLGVDGCTKHVIYLPIITISSHSQILLEKKLKTRRLFRLKYISKPEIFQSNQYIHYFRSYNVLEHNIF